MFRAINQLVGPYGKGRHLSFIRCAHSLTVSPLTTPLPWAAFASLGRGRLTPPLNRVHNNRARIHVTVAEPTV